MTEAEWLACDKVEQMLFYLKHKAKVVRSAKGRRKLRLFACGCCRQVWPLIEDPRSRRLVELSERQADGQADPAELAKAEVAATAAKAEADLAGGGLSPMTHTRKVGAAIAAALLTAAKEPSEAARRSSGCALCAVGGSWSIGVPNPAWDAQEKRQSDLFRCLFGNPFRPTPAVRSSWLRWRSGTVGNIARAIYEGRRYEEMPVLADALEEAGCTTPDVLRHCRQPGEHGTGCWVVDLLTGRS
jgi:hypothetical protein